MNISENHAVQIALEYAASRALSRPYPLKENTFSALLRSSDAFSKSLGVDGTHWAISFELAVPENIVLCPDVLTILVSEDSGKPTLATTM